VKSIALIFTLLLCPLAFGTATAHVVGQPVAAAAPAAALTSTAGGKPVAAAAAVDEEAMVCERVKELGSTRLKKVCKTVAQREREREAARDAVNTRSRDR